MPWKLFDDNGTTQGSFPTRTRTPGAGAPGGESEVIDLTEMSSTVVYTEVYNMVTTPDDYVGKTIKVDGLYTPSFFDTTGDYYPYILVEAATACCQQPRAAYEN